MIKYDNFIMQNYLKSKSGLNSFEDKRIFNLRSHSLDVSANFPRKYQTKQVCVCGNEDDQLHCYTCILLHAQPLISMGEFVDYNELYGENITKQKLVTEIVMSGFERRKQIQSSLFDGEDPAGSQAEQSDDHGVPSSERKHK